MALLNPGGAIAQFKRNDCSIPPVEVIWRGGVRKKPVEKEIINDYNGDLVRFFRVLQRNENLERLIGRLFLSFNSEQIFRANKALLAEVPNILDDLTETSVIIENTQWNDFDLAVAFYENQVFSFSSTGKNFAITK